MSAYVQDTQFLTRRTVVLFAIVALHIFLIWVLATGLASRAIQMVAPPIQTNIVQQTKQQLKPPPPPPPQLQKQEVEVPPPVVNINIPQESQTHAITVVKKVVRAAPPPPSVPGTPLRAIAKDFPSTDEYYPDASRRLGEQGTALVKLCIGAGGRVIGDPAIQRSSGSSRLDQAAVRYAKATSGHFDPETRNGQAVTVCTALPIKFQLTDSF
ncbi:MAG TPA: energy transducer TonB [Steroidobacteraceae bacterium]|nr:energy transducer TonB [Steroidobacteraceae bacterium]